MFLLKAVYPSKCTVKMGTNMNQNKPSMYQNGIYIVVVERVENLSNRVESSWQILESSRVQNQLWKLTIESSFEFLFFGNFFMIFKSGSFQIQRCCGKSSELAKKWRKGVTCTKSWAEYLLNFAGTPLLNLCKTFDSKSYFQSLGWHIFELILPTVNCGQDGLSSLQNTKGNLEYNLQCTFTFRKLQSWVMGFLGCSLDTAILASNLVH